MSERVTIFDTTLRDGEQSPGISLDAAEKLEIAEQLARLGVDYIEAGFPVASQGDFEAVQAIARTVGLRGPNATDGLRGPNATDGLRGPNATDGLRGPNATDGLRGPNATDSLRGPNATAGPIIAALSRTQLADVDRCWDALRDAERARIHVFISTSPNHMEHMLKMNQAQVLDAIRSGVARARDHTDDVEFSPQDATRTPLDFMLEVLRAAVEAGATTLNIPDTVGYGIPGDFGALIQYIRREVAGDYVTSVHCHNDLGLATANSLAGVQAGARQIEVCVNGLGERAGNAALEEVVMALRIRADQFPGLETGVRTEELARTSRLVSRLTGYPIQYNKAVVGRNAFAHESGIHQHGVLAERSTYEIIDATSVGQVGSQIVLGKHSGRHAFADTLDKMGITVTGAVLNSAFARFKELADRKVQITDADLEAIVAEELGSTVASAFGFEDLEVSGGTVGVPRARVVLSRDGEKLEATSEGDGMIDAACKAIKAATGVDGRLTDFNVSSVTGGIDALGDVIIQLEADGVRVSGRGVSTDVVEASARAYLGAVNKVMRVRSRTDVRQTEVGP